VLSRLGHDRENVVAGRATAPGPQSRGKESSHSGTSAVQLIAIDAAMIATIPGIGVGGQLRTSAEALA